MSEFVNLPALGESVTEGTVTRWLVSVGDTVSVDQPIVEVSTDKVDTEVPSPIAGTIEEILVPEDETVEVGAALVKIGDGSAASGGEAPSEPAAEETSSEEAPAQEESAQPAAQTESEDSPAESSASAGSAEGSEITLPALGESVIEGTVTRWLKAVGDSVEVDEPLLEVSTDKVDTEVPSPVAGTLLETRVAEDETVEVGAVLAVVGSASSAPAKESPAEEKPAEPKAPAQEPAAQKSTEQKSPEQPAAPAAPAAAPEKPKPATAARESAPAQSSSSSATGGYVTPLVRKLANERGVDLGSVSGSGVGGRIRKEDVEAAAKAASSSSSSAAVSSPSAPQAPAVVEDTTLRGTSVKAPRIRQVISRRMRESLDISTQLTQVQEVDMTRVAKLRAASKKSFEQQNGTKLTFLPFIAKAVAEALKQHPKLNAEYDEQTQQITYHNAEHLAFAVDTDKGLLVPVVQDAGQLNLAGLSAKIADVAARTRSGKIGPDELSGGTFSITNIGSVGALFDTPIINQPQVAILGTGAIVKRPVVLTSPECDDTIAIRHMMYLSLTYDHRLVDGADAGRFLQTLKARLEGGAFEGDLGL